MTVTEKQLEANRANAQLGGPKTQEGKDISKFNALKHGLLAKTVVITTGPFAEDPQEFYDHLAALQKQLLPQGPLEQMLVEKMAVAYLRSARAARQEKDLYIEDSATISARIRHISKEPQKPPISIAEFDRLLRYEGTIERQFYRAMHQLERLQRLRAGHMIPAPIAVDIDLNAG